MLLLPSRALITNTFDVAHFPQSGYSWLRKEKDLHQPTNQPTVPSLVIGPDPVHFIVGFVAEEADNRKCLLCEPLFLTEVQQSRLDRSGLRTLATRLLGESGKLSVGLRIFRCVILSVRARPLSDCAKSEYYIDVAVTTPYTQFK